MRISGGFFDVYESDPEKGKPGTMQVSAGVKVSKKAVERNKVKRRLREALRAVKIPPGKNVRVVALGGASQKKFSEIKKALENIFNRP